jgi:hypothetical protein
LRRITFPLFTRSSFAAYNKTVEKQPEPYAKLFVHLRNLDIAGESEITQEKAAHLWNAPPSLAVQDGKIVMKNLRIKFFV